MSGVEPLLALAMGASAAGTVLQGVSTYVAAEDEKVTAEANAKLARSEAVERASLEAAEGRRMAATARTRAGATGGATGSALDVIGELEAEGLYRSRAAIYRGRVEYDNFNRIASAAKKKKTLAVASTVVNTGATLLTMSQMPGATTGGSTSAASTATRRAARRGRVGL